MNEFRKINKKVLVTGAAGFVGSHLCERLLAEGHEVIGIDNLYTGTAANVAPLTNWPSFSFRQHNVSAPYWAHADQIYNLACAASPVHYQAEPIDTMRTSFLGALHALEIAKASSGTVLQASTSEIYGDPMIHPQPESYWGNVNPYGARSCYDEGKRSAESLFYSYRSLFELDARIARIFNTYGPRMRQDDGRVVSNFIVQALKGDPITVYGDGSQTRSFCYVDDLVDGLIRLMNCPAETLRGPVNLGNPNEFTVLQLAELVLEMTGSKSPLKFKPLPDDDPKLRQPDIAQARDQLDWAPRTQLREGLRRTIDYFDLALSQGDNPRTDCDITLKKQLNLSEPLGQTF
ncbi:MAG: UDP-glucuronic acid decarboxylase family protein [Pseudomonadota bacterium]